METVQKTSLECQLFDWEQWEELGNHGYLFYKCILKVPVGSYEVGSQIDSIALLNETSELAFYNEKGEQFEIYNLKLSIA